MSESQSVFEVTFGCENCGNEWSREFPTKYRVSTSMESFNGRAMIRDTTKSAFEGEQPLESVVCGVCELHEDVVIKNRDPINGGGADD